MATLSQRILKDKIDTKTRELKTARKNVGNNPQRKAHVKKLEKQLATLVSKRTELVPKKKVDAKVKGSDAVEAKRPPIAVPPKPPTLGLPQKVPPSNASIKKDKTSKRKDSIASRQNSLGPLSEKDRRNKIIGSVQGGDEPVKTAGTGLRDKAAKAAADKAAKGGNNSAKAPKTVIIEAISNKGLISSFIIIKTLKRLLIPNH